MSVTLLCFPFAGAGPSFFGPWKRAATSSVSVLPVSFPGRERRISEPPHTDVTVAMEGTFTELRGRLSEVGRVALFGHSLGAVLAYEMSRRIQAWSPDKLVHLFVSGSPGPRKGRAQRTADLTDDEFLARVEELAGYRHPVFDIPEMREMLLPSLRADVRMHEEYRQTDTSPISVPVTAIRGTSDALVSRAEMEEWGAVTTEKFEAVELPGGHMYLADAPPHPLDLIEAVLGQ